MMDVKKDRIYYLFLGIYLVAIVYGWTDTSPFFTSDTISYFNIARKYAEGHWLEALNAYWSPLLSWLLILPSYIDSELFFSFRLLNFISGGLILFSVHQVLKTRLNNPYYLVPMYSILIAWMYIIQLSSCTPDFISIACFFFFIVQLEKTIQQNGNAALLYLSLFLLFFSKGIFMYLMPLIALMMWAFYFKNKTVQKVFTKVFLFSLFCIALWSSMMFVKYDRFFISSAGAYNLSTKQADGTVIHYRAIAGLLPPSDVYAICAMEDPSYFPNKSVSIEAIQNNISNNIPIALYLWNYMSYFSYLLPLLLIGLLFYFKNDPIRVLLATAALAVFCIYLPVTYEERYVHLTMFIAFILVPPSIEKIWFNNIETWKPIAHLGFSLLIVLSFAAFAKNIPFLYQEYQGLAPRFKTLHYKADELSRLLPLQNKRIANTAEGSGVNLTDLLAWKNRAQYYGEFAPHTSKAEAQKQIEKCKIDYLFLYTPLDTLYYKDSKVIKINLLNL